MTCHRSGSFWRIFLASTALTTLSVFTLPAAAQNAFACVETHTIESRSGTRRAEVRAAEAEQTIKRIARSIGLTAPVKPIPCHFGKVDAIYISPTDATADVPEGEYITYNPDYIRELIGRDKIQLYALLGHELGHFVNRHFIASRLTREEKETQADHFAGCAVARMNGDWAALENLLERLRPELDQQYPSRLKSLAAASEGFKSCGGSLSRLNAKLSPAPKAFCSNVDAIFAMADDEFYKLRVGEPRNGTYSANFTLAGFERCTVSTKNSTSFTCYSAQQESRNKELRRRDDLIARAKKCLGEGWAESEVSFLPGKQLQSGEKFVSAYINDMPSFEAKNSTVYYTALNIGLSRRSPDISRVNVVAKAERPKEFCPSLKEFARGAGSSFTEFKGRARGDSFFTNTQVSGFGECTLNNLKRPDGFSKWYVSCKLPTLQDKESADLFVKEFSKDINECVGAGWTGKLKTNYDGLQSYRVESTVDPVEIELRMREEDEMWRVVLDVEQAG